MALTYTIDHKGQANGVSATITSNTISASTGDYIAVVGVYGDNADSTAWTVSNTGTAITWTQQAATNTGSNCKLVLWTGTAGATPPTTVSIQSTAGGATDSVKSITTIIHTGQHATTPLPAGNIFTGADGTDVSQSITPTSSGSCLWLICGDWDAIDPASGGIAAGTSCSLAATAYFSSGAMTSAPIRPTTQPRSDASSFTIAESDTGGKIAWIAFEVQAAASSSTPKKMMLLGVS